MPETNGQILGNHQEEKHYYQVGREESMVDIQEVYSEKGNLDSHERKLNNSYHNRRRPSMLWVVRMLLV